MALTNIRSFSSRLPDRCAMINRKLGGPVVVSPPKARLSKAASFSGSQSKPGAATKRPVPVKRRPDQSLKRVLTDDREQRRSMSRGPGRAISLMRSATMSMVPGLKREGSEVPSMSSIPSADSQSVEANRGGLLNSRRFSQREIDLSAMVPKANNRAEKQAVVEAELKEAISALKKPNRELAGRSIVETAEKRSASISRSKYSIRTPNTNLLLTRLESKKPIRNPLFQSIQISATPKANRQKEMFTRPHNSSSEQRIDDSFVIPPSSLPKIPQSVSRPSCGPSPINPFFSSVQATPTRRSIPPFSRVPGNTGAFSGDHPPSSPLHVRRSSGQLFTTVPASTTKTNSAFTSFDILDTPIKSMTGHGHSTALERDDDKENIQKHNQVEKHLPQHEIDEVTNEDSIYKALGWDDIDELA